MDRESRTPPDTGIYAATLLIDHGVSSGFGDKRPDRTEVDLRFLLPTRSDGFMDYRIGTVNPVSVRAPFGLREAFKDEVKKIFDRCYLSNPDTGLVRVAIKELTSPSGTLLPPVPDADALESRVIFGYDPLLVFLSQNQ
jgi:hypothetical protein